MRMVWESESGPDSTATFKNRLMTGNAPLSADPAGCSTTTGITTGLPEKDIPGAL